MSLEAMLGIFHDAPEKPRTPPASVAADLLWWYRILSQPTISRPIPGPCELLDIHAFSDASSSVGIGIVIGERWRAWRLVPGWKSTGRDIGWAKAIGFEFLIKTILRLSTQPDNFKVYGDNNGIVQGWWKGRSRNPETNLVFRHIHDAIDGTGSSFHTRYVPTKHNPADGPSRGVFPSERLLLPPIDLPTELKNLVVDFNHPPLAIELHLRREGLLPTPLPKVHDPPLARQSAAINHELERRGNELFRESSSWLDY